MTKLIFIMDEVEKNIDDGVMEMEEEEVDEFVEAFDTLEESGEQEIAKISQYQQLINNPRLDEKALKIKEKCIYKYVNTQLNEPIYINSTVCSTIRGNVYLLLLFIFYFFSHLT